LAIPPLFSRGTFIAGQSLPEHQRQVNGVTAHGAAPEAATQRVRPVEPDGRVRLPGRPAEGVGALAGQGPPTPIHGPPGEIVLCLGRQGGTPGAGEGQTGQRQQQSDQESARSVARPASSTTASRPLPPRNAPRQKQSWCYRAGLPALGHIFHL